MPGDLAAAVDFDHRRARITDRTVGRAGPPARGVHRRVLEQQAGVGYLGGGAKRMQLTLQLPGLLVPEGAGAEAGPDENELAVHLFRLCRAGEPAGRADVSAISVG